MMPKRIQRKRMKGWKMPVGVVYVGRPGKFGNPFNFSSAEFSFTAIAFGCRADRRGRREASVKAYREWIGTDLNRRTMEFERGVMMESGGKIIEVGARAKAGAAPAIKDIRDMLRGKDLACWCSLDQPCHADVLLEIANVD